MPISPLRLAKCLVTKRLAPNQPGTKKLSQRYGDALVCVRYRHDQEAGRRYTTVELVVEEAPIAADARTPLPVHLRIPFNDLVLRQAVLQHGGVWDSTLRLWRLSPKAAKAIQRQSRATVTLPVLETRSGRK